MIALQKLQKKNWLTFKIAKKLECQQELASWSFLFLQKVEAVNNAGSIMPPPSPYSKIPAFLDNTIQVPFSVLNANVSVLSASHKTRYAPIYVP